MKYKGIVTFLICCMLLTLSQNSIAHNNNCNNEITLDFTIDLPAIENNTVNSKTAHTITIEGLPNSCQEGYPCLPWTTATILLPPDSTVKDIQINAETYTIGTGYNVSVQSKARPIQSSYNETIQLSQPINTYDEHQFFPQHVADDLEISYYRGYKICTVTINPVQYLHSEGKLLFHEHISITLKLQESTEKSNSMYRALLKDQMAISEMVINPDMVEQYPQITDSKNNVDMLILTSSEYEQELLPLCYFHNSHDVSTLLQTIEEIDGNDAESIRDYIREVYEADGIEYVLLGGDDDVIPTTILFCDDERIASDLFYSCLDGPFNYDGDERWGEPNDGTNGQDIDKYGEVFVGRASVDSAEQMKQFVQKTIRYMTSGGQQYHDSVLLAGEKLDDYTWGGDSLDTLIGHSNSGGYSTDCIPQQEYDILKLYDKTYPGNNWPKSEIIDLVNSNEIHFLNHYGHSHSFYCMKMNSVDIDEFTNTNLFLLYTLGCHAADFDVGDCFCEYLVSETPNGAFAAIGNSRSGWYYLGEADGPSNHFVREFYDAIFDEDKTMLGEAFQDSKSDSVSYISHDSLYRYVLYTLNLFGDPCVDLLSRYVNHPPQQPVVTVNETSPSIDENIALSIIVEDSDGDLLSCVVDWGDGTYYESESYFESGDPLVVFHSFSYPGFFNVSVQIADYAGSFSEWSDPIMISVENICPEVPETPSGEIEGKIETSYQYSTSSIDPDGNVLYFQWEWGDGSTSYWLGPYESDENVFVSHTFDEKGLYSIRVRCKDDYDYISDWSDPLPVSMPRVSDNPWIDLLQNIVGWTSEKFPVFNWLMSLPVFSGLH